MSPWTLAAGLLAALLFFGGGYALGTKHQRNEDRAAQLDAVNTVIELAEYNRELDGEAAVKAAGKRSGLSSSITVNQEKINESISTNPSTCLRDAGRVGLLNDAIDQVNRTLSSGIGPVSKP